MCPDGWLVLNNKCYQIEKGNNANTTTWCDGNGLAVIENKEDYLDIWKLVQKLQIDALLINLTEEYERKVYTCHFMSFLIGKIVNKIHWKVL